MSDESARSRFGALPPTDHPATARQLEVLRAWATLTGELGRPPTLRELGASVGIGSTNGVTQVLVALHRRGYVEHTPGASRGVRLTRRGLEAVGLCPHCRGTGFHPAARA